MEKVSVLLALCEGNPPVTTGFLSQRARNLGIDVFFDVSQTKQLNKHSSFQWFQTPWCSLLRHHNEGDFAVAQSRNVLQVMPMRAYKYLIAISWSKDSVHMQWRPVYSTTFGPLQNGQHFADGNSRIFSLMIMVGFGMKLHWNMFSKVWLTIRHHWFM